MGWTFYDSSGRKLNTTSTLIDNLDIDGATDIGAAIVDADLFIVDDGAGGTNRKTAASRIVTYIDSNASGSAKAYCNIQANGTLDSSNNYNIASVTDTGTGDRTVVWDTDFATASTYPALSTLVDVGTTQTNQYFLRATKAVDGARIVIQTASANADVEHSVVAFGDQ